MDPTIPAKRPDHVITNKKGNADGTQGICGTSRRVWATVLHLVPILKKKNYAKRASTWGARQMPTFFQKRKLQILKEDNIKQIEVLKKGKDFLQRTKNFLKLNSPVEILSTEKKYWRIFLFNILCTILKMDKGGI